MSHRLTDFESRARERKRRLEARQRFERMAPDGHDGTLPPTMVTEYLEGRAPARQGGGAVMPEPPTYYGYAPIKKPPWKAHIPLYFFVGGVAAGAQLVGGVAQLSGGTRGGAIARAGRYLAAPLIAAGQLLLILDLGRSERAHHMFRIVKTRSPMSLGSWALAAFSGLSGALFGMQLLEDVLRVRQARALAVPLAALSLPLSLFVAAYTGVLLSATAVPLWAKGRRFLSPMFMSSAIATGASAIGLTLGVLGRAPSSPALAGTIAASLGAELAMGVGLELNAGVSGRHLTRPPEAIRHRAAVALGVLAPLVLLTPRLASGRSLSREQLLVASACALAGGLLTRFSIVSAGKHSADDARSYWDLTAE